MKPNRTFWLLYSAGAVVVFIALVWVSVMVLRLEAQAQHEQLVRLALWRMDAWLGKRLQTENSRQYFEYQPFYPQRRAYNNLLGEIAPGEVIVPSPLLTFHSEFFPLHFQLDDQHRLTSPQTPAGNWRDVAESAYLPVGEIEQRQPLLERVQSVMLPQADVFVGCVIEAESQLVEVMREVELPPSAATEGGAGLVPFPNGFSAPQTAEGVAGGPSPGNRSQKATSNSDLQARAANSAYSPQWESQQEQQREQQFQTMDAPPPTGAPVNAPIEELLDAHAKTQAGVQGDASEGADAGAKRDKVNNDETLHAAVPSQPAVEVGLLVPLWMNTGGSAGVGDDAFSDSSRVKIRSASLTDESSSISSSSLRPSTELLFVRRVRVQGENGVEQTLYQGALGDWPALRAAMLAQITDLFPEATLEPVSRDAASIDGGDSDLLAGVPARIVAPCPLLTDGPLFTPARTTLLLTWLAVAGAVVAAGLALRSSIAFGLKRSRFASAVTHELRTPLTTFRMYSEMLAEGMVRDEAQRQTYLDTLKTESSRLATLVENVLSYARLEDGRAITHARQAMTVAQLFNRVSPMLQRRANEAGMTLTIINEAPDSETVTTDVEAVGQILFNLVDNACKYARGGEGAGGADDRSIAVRARIMGDQLEFTVRDHGPGIRPEHARIIFAPFERGAHGPGDTIPGVGLGLALCRGLARDMGGDLTLEKPNGWGLNGASIGQSGGACFKLTVKCG